MFVGNIRVDQAWGSISTHGRASVMRPVVTMVVSVLRSPTQSPVNGHPGSAWGWAVGGGFRLTNFLAPKDTFEAQINYGKGATG